MYFSILENSKKVSKTLMESYRNTDIRKSKNILEVYIKLNFRKSFPIGHPFWKRYYTYGATVMSIYGIQSFKILFLINWLRQSSRKPFRDYFLENSSIFLNVMEFCKKSFFQLLIFWIYIAVIFSLEFSRKLIN